MYGGLWIWSRVGSSWLESSERGSGIVWDGGRVGMVGMVGGDLG